MVNADIMPTNVAECDICHANHITTTRKIHNPFTAAAEPMKYLR
jgi:hypothetical protein